MPRPLQRREFSTQKPRAGRRVNLTTPRYLRFKEQGPNNLGIGAAVDYRDLWARPARPYAIDGLLMSIEAAFQITDPSRWMATQAVIFLPTLIGSTRQYMMKGVPSFL